MKDYEIRIERLKVLGSVVGLLEMQLDSDKDYLKHYQQMKEEREDVEDDYIDNNINNYIVRIRTMEELLKFLNSDDKKLPWNNSNPF